MDFKDIVGLNKSEITGDTQECLKSLHMVKKITHDQPRRRTLSRASDFSRSRCGYRYVFYARASASGGSQSAPCDPDTPLLWCS